MFKYLCYLQKYWNWVNPAKILAISSASEFYSLILWWMKIIYFYKFKNLPSFNPKEFQFLLWGKKISG